jgi:hypothetical protein
MTLEEELEHVKREHPRAWAHLLGVDDLKVMLPKFDDNDEMYFSQQEKEAVKHEGISEPRPCA